MVVIITVQDDGVHKMEMFKRVPPKTCTNVGPSNIFSQINDLKLISHGLTVKTSPSSKRSRTVAERVRHALVRKRIHYNH